MRSPKTKRDEVPLRPLGPLFLFFSLFGGGGRARLALFVFSLLHAFVFGCMNAEAMVMHIRARRFLVLQNLELQLHKKRGERRFRVEAVHGLRQQRCRRQYG